MNLLMFNLAVDEKHVTLAFGLRWIEALAECFDHIDIVTMTAGHYRLPDNVAVWSLGRERGYPKWLRVLRFYWLIWHILRQRRIHVAFTHMVPLFAILFWPVGRFTGQRNVLWYAHGSTPITLKIAHRLVDHVVSSTPEGFRLLSDKVSFIGQGIDVTRYRLAPRTPAPTFRILTVGRLAPSKGLDLLIDALSVWRPAINWHLILVGDGTSAQEMDYAAALRQRAMDVLGAPRVTFTGRLDADAIATLMSQADVFVNMSQTGSLDKAIIEAMASGCPVVSSNDAFRAIAYASGFPRCAIDHTAEALLVALDWLIDMDVTGRETLGRQQALVARRDHSLDGLIRRLHATLVRFAPCPARPT